jgi:hypothetical protein
MQKRSKLMIYVRAELAPDAIRWAIRLSQTTSTFCSQCVGYSLQNMERGLNVWRDVAPRQWDFVNIWKLRQGKTSKTPLRGPTLQRVLALQQGQYRQAQPKLKEFERALQAGEANLKVVFQVQEGPEGPERVERWPEKLRRTARYFRVKPNELANRMIAAGVHALENEDPDYEPDFVIEYRQKVVIPKIEQYQSEKKLAEAFNPYSDVPKELESDGWAFVGLIEETNLHNREAIHGFRERKSVEETFSEISRDTTLSHAYLDRLKSIYTSPIYQDSIEAHPLREKKLKKEIIDAWVEEWRRTNRSKPSERAIIADITSLLPQLSEDGLRRVRAEVDIALSLRGGEGTGGTIS